MPDLDSAPEIRNDPIISDRHPVTTPGHTTALPVGPPATPGATATTPAPYPDGDAAAVCALYATLCGPGVRYRRLRDNGTPSPDHRRPVAAAATVGAALRDGWALVAPLAPDLVVLDLDGCAVPRVLDALETAASAHGALMAYRAASGSPDSEHHAYAVPAASRGAFRRAVERLRDRYGADGGGHRRFNLQDRTADNPRSRGGYGLRLPCSPSLKAGGGMVWPMTADGLPVLSLETAARMVRDARAGAGLPAAPTAPVRGERRGAGWSARRDRSGGYESARRGPGRSSTRRGPVVVPSSWSPRDRDAVLTSHPVGQRSDGALVALRVVVRHYGTAWTPAVRDLVMAAPAFRKYAADGERRARRWWDQTAGAYLRWLDAHGATVEHLETSDRDRAAVGGWLAGAWSPLLSRYGVERAARAWRALVCIGQRVMLDGRGLESRRVAVRDLVDYGAARSPATAWRVLRDLETAGVLLRASEFTLDAPLEAVRWSVPRDLRLDTDETVSSHPLSAAVLSPALTADGCAWTGATVWAVWCLCGASPASAAALESVTGASGRSVRRWLSVLEGAGLVERSAAGLWSAVGLDDGGALVGAAAGASAAVERLESARALVEVERGLWRVLVGAGRAGRPGRRPAAAAAPGVVAPGAARDAVAVESGARDGWPDGGESALFGLEVLEDGRGGVCPVRGGPVAAWSG